MADTHETIADIIAEMRRGTRLPGYWRSCDVNEILQYHADRLEAAHKRERNRNFHRFATAEEAWDAYDAWVESYRAQGKTEPFNEFGWLYAEAQEGGANG